jgi:hypothetical protein
MLRTEQHLDVLTKQCKSEREEIHKASLKFGPVYEELSRKVSQYSKAQIIARVAHYCEQTRTVGPSRTQKRQKRGMIWWLCEHAPNFPEGFDVPPKVHDESAENKHEGDGLASQPAETNEDQQWLLLFTEDYQLGLDYELLN